MKDIGYLYDNFLEDPWTVYRKYRREQPVFWSEKVKMHCVFSYSDCENVLCSSDYGVEYTFRRTKQAFGKTILDIDDERHQVLRKVVLGMVRNDELDALNQEIFIPAIEESIKDIEGKSSIEFNNVFANRVPAKVISRFLGMDEKDERWLYENVDYMVHYLDGSVSNVEIVTKRRDAIHDYIRTMIIKNAGTTKGFTSRYKELVESNRLSMEEFIGLATIILAGGIETSVSTIGNVMICLLNNPHCQEGVIDDETYTGKVVTETLRYEPPQHDAVRFARINTELSGNPIREGQALKLLLASANRDETRYPRAEEFWPERPEMSNLSFGKGLHGCVGRRFAHKEITTAIHAFLKKFRVESNSEVVPKIVGGSFRKANHIPLLIVSR